MNKQRIRELQQAKREISPDDFGEECPACGEPFAVESSGIMFHDVEQSIDAVSWVRFCLGDLPDHYDKKLMREDGFDPETATMAYIHKDEHIDVVG